MEVEDWTETKKNEQTKVLQLLISSPLLLFLRGIIKKMDNITYLSCD